MPAVNPVTEPTVHPCHLVLLLVRRLLDASQVLLAGCYTQPCHALEALPSVHERHLKGTRQEEAGHHTPCYPTARPCTQGNINVQCKADKEPSRCITDLTGLEETVQQTFM